MVRKPDLYNLLSSKQGVAGSSPAGHANLFKGLMVISFSLESPLQPHSNHQDYFSIVFRAWDNIGRVVTPGGTSLYEFSNSIEATIQIFWIFTFYLKSD